MFIDPAVNPTTRAPAERNVCDDEYARSATFRSSGARRIFLNLCSINISSLRDEELCRRSTSSHISQKNKKLIVCITGSPRLEVASARDSQTRQTLPQHLFCFFATPLK